jgi:hypothetical protein
MYWNPTNPPAASATAAPPTNFSRHAELHEGDWITLDVQCRKLRTRKSTFLESAHISNMLSGRWSPETEVSESRVREGLDDH